MTNMKSTHQPDPSVHPSTIATRGSVSCIICQAVYTPAHGYEAIDKASPIALESALMSVCHFCFRCRRPSCPGCWDEVHGVCGACVLDARLPFRSTTPPLPGSLFPPTQQAQQPRKHALPSRLICVQPGRFQQGEVPVETMTTVPLQAIIPQRASLPARNKTTLPRIPALPPSQPAGQKPHSVDERRQEIAEIITRPERLSSPRYDSVIRPERRSTPRRDIAEIATRPERPSSPKNKVDKQAQVDEITEVATRSLLKQRIEQVLTFLSLFLLILILMLILCAELFPDANDFIARLLHIDIRGEITYLWQLIRHLF